jgi:hypothetical protein
MARKLLLFLVLIIVSAAPALAQDAAPWTAYLYNNATRELVSVALDGAQAAHDLGLAPDVYPMQSDFPVSPDGRQIAYCITLYDPNGAPPATALIVRDLAAAVDAARVELGSTIGCDVGGFSADGAQVAVGVVRGYPGDPALDPSLPIWSVMLVDVATGAIQEIANSLSPGIDTSTDEARFSILPMFQYFGDGEIVFALQPFGSEGNPGAPAYRWRAASGTLERVRGWGGFGIDYLEATGELAWLDLDPARVSGTPMGPMPIYNVVKITDGNGVDSIVYESGEWLPYDVEFIDGGRRLLVTMLESGDPDNPTVQATRLVAIDRAGVVTELGTYGSFVQTASAPDGYVVLWGEDPGGTTPPPIHLEYHTVTENREIWSILSDNMGISWTIANTTPMAAAGEPLPPFVALPQ